MSALVEAAVLAGGPAGGVVAESTGVAHRMLVPVAGQPMVVRTLERLRQAQTIGRLVVAAHSAVQEHLPAGLADMVVPGESTFVGNLMALAEAIGVERAMLACTGDMPLVTPQAVDDFVTRSAESGAEVCYCAVPREDSERLFPGGRRTYVRLREGTFTGGNLTYLGPGFVPGHQDVIERLFEYRKRPVKLAGMLGLSFVLGLALGTLSLSAVERRAGRILRCRAAVIVSHHAELGFDVDKLEDLETLRLVMSGQEPPE